MSGAAAFATPPRPVSARAALGVGLALLVAPFFASSLWTSGHGGSLYIAIHLAFTAIMVVAWRWRVFSMSELVWIGALLRLALIVADPATSNDSERYLWDGAVALAGFDPYITAPDNPLVAGLREVWPTPPEHAHYPTLYPPAAITIFALAAAAGPEWGLWVWKAILGGAGVASLVLMRAALSHWRLDRHFALFALSPLLVLEAGVGAHLDALLVLAVAIMIYAYAHERWWTLGMALGWSVCVKLSPIVLLVPLFWMLPRGAFERAACATIAVIAGVYGAALLLGLAPIGVLPTFFEKWRGGAPLFTTLDAVLDGTTLLAATTLIAAFGLALAAYFAARGKGALAGMVALSVPLMVSPVVFPWYLSALVPLFVLRPNWAVALWLTTLPFTYEVLNDWLSASVWAPASWPLTLIAIGWLVGLALDASFGRAHRDPHARLPFHFMTKETVR